MQPRGGADRGCFPIAAIHNVTVMPHSFYDGPGLLAAIQVMAVLGADAMVEWRYFDLEAQIYGDALHAERGRVAVPQGRPAPLEAHLGRRALRTDTSEAEVAVTAAAEVRTAGQRRQLDADRTAAMAHPGWCPVANGASEPPHSGQAPYDFVGVTPLHWCFSSNRLSSPFNARSSTSSRSLV